VELINVLARAFPFQLTVESEIKFLPFIVRVNGSPPAVALAGEKEMITGVGFLAE